MTRAIDYYFTLPSPWTYLGHALFLKICARHGVAIRYRPMPIGEVFDATGSLPLPKRPPARQRYRFVEMQRWREKRALPLVLKPKHFPFDATLINRAIVGLAEAGRDPGPLAGAALTALWAEDRNLGDEAEAARLIAGSGYDPTEILALARTDATAEAYARNGRDAIAADVFGAPGYVLDGEVFWDRTGWNCSMMRSPPDAPPTGPSEQLASCRGTIAKSAHCLSNHLSTSGRRAPCARPSSPRSRLSASLPVSPPATRPESGRSAAP